MPPVWMAGSKGAHLHFVEIDVSGLNVVERSFLDQAVH